MHFDIYRYDPDSDSAPYMQRFTLEADEIHAGMMLLEALLVLKQHDHTLSFRRSCGEGVCGSDALNVNGRNCLACVTLLADLSEPIVLRPLPGQPVIRDLIVDQTPFFKQYKAVRPWLEVKEPEPEREYLQSPAQREKLDGLYECILCACCSSSCPSFWWNPDKFLGPAALLQAYRFVCDSRDHYSAERLAALDGPYRLFRCHTIMNCVEVCPKGLNPTRAIGKLKELMLAHSM
jgi:succinate dehydrogenase / fumarate reductase, iron-sulfur subunit